MQSARVFPTEPFLVSWPFNASQLCIGAGFDAPPGLAGSARLWDRAAGGTPPPPQPPRFVQATPHRTLLDSRSNFVAASNGGLLDISDNVCRGSAARYMNFGIARESLEGDDHRPSMAKQHLCPSDTGRSFCQFSDRGFWRCIFSIGPAVCYVCCVIPGVLRCMIFIFCVKEADLGTMAFVAYCAPWFSEQCTMSFGMYHAQCNA